jgi:hypothetical protein
MSMANYLSRIVRRRWGDDDHYFGPLTYARDRRNRSLAVVLASGCDEYPGSNLRISAFGHTVILALPQWLLMPYREKVHAKWDEATIKRIGRDWYWQVDPREYGFTVFEGHLNVSLGRQTMDSSTEQRWGCFFPWTQWRHVRHSFYGLQGEHVATLPDTGKPYLGNPSRWEQEQAVSDATPTVSFEFDDFDAERIIATTKIEEREWRAGSGWFKWLALFRKPRVSRDLDLRFSSEVGKRKGSWKGGTIGHSIEMLPGELHEAAFRRYCAKEGLRFVDADVPYVNRNELEMPKVSA